MIPASYLSRNIYREHWLEDKPAPKGLRKAHLIRAILLRLISSPPRLSTDWQHTLAK